MSDIVDALRRLDHPQSEWPVFGNGVPVAREAADEIERLRNLWIKAGAQTPPEGSYDELVELDRLRARCAELDKALEPFAKAPCTGPNAFNRAALSDSDFRLARATLQGQDNGR